jgi:hypothetical protein
VSFSVRAMTMNARRLEAGGRVARRLLWTSKEGERFKDSSRSWHLSSLILGTMCRFPHEKRVRTLEVSCLEPDHQTER